MKKSLEQRAAELKMARNLDLGDTMDDRITALDEDAIESLANTQTTKAMDIILANDEDERLDPDALRPVIKEALKLMGMTVLKRHMAQILNIQEEFLERTEAKNEETINTLRTLVMSGNVGIGTTPR